jgi:hypothetical protein
MDLPGRTLTPRRRAAPRDTSTAVMWRDLNVIALGMGSWIGPPIGRIHGFFDTTTPPTS